MPVLHCPICGNRLRIKKENSSWLVVCKDCQMTLYMPIEAKNKKRPNDLLDAYFKFVDLVDNKILEPGQAIRITEDEEIITEEEPTKVFEELDKHQTGMEELIRSMRSIVKEVEQEGADFESLPKALQQILSTRLDYVVKYKQFKPGDAEYGCKITELQLPRTLLQTLKDRGIERLYKFQEEAYNSIIKGENVVIVAPTGQGKTEAFILPIFSRIVKMLDDNIFSHEIKAILIYPTKALARDQYDKLRIFTRATGISVAIFDGDTPDRERQRIYDNPPDILITNPDILHYHLGRMESRLRELLFSVRIIVFDEIHLYNGSFGTNVYFILKRLERLTGPLQTIGASATIGNPQEFAELLFDRPVKPIISKKGKRGTIHFVMMYPTQRSKYSMIVNIVSALVRGGFKVLVFGNTHVEAELINLMLQKGKINSNIHRSGLGAKHRRTVEQEFKTGKLQVLVSTPTLELGIDIGDLDAVVSLLTNVTRLTQRIGRAGRKGQESIAVLALREKDPISAFYKNYPDLYFTDIENGYIEPMNDVVAYYQILATAMEGGLQLKTFEKHREIYEKLEQDGLIKIIDDERVVIADRYKARKLLNSYNIRGIGDVVYIYNEKNKVIGKRNMPMAASELFPEAIYIHGGKKYKSLSFKYMGGVGKAIVSEIKEDIRDKTVALRFSEPEIIKVLEEKDVMGIHVKYCDLQITEVVTGYVVKDIYKGTFKRKKDLPEPIRYTFKTKGFVLRAPEPKESILKFVDNKSKDTEEDQLLMGAFHAFEHVLIESSDMLTGGSSREIGGISMGTSGVIFVYDGTPGGNGASKLLYKRLDEAIKRSILILEGCKCKSISGCPNCTYSYSCGNNNTPLFKLGALESFKLVMAGAQTTFRDEYKAEKPFI